MNYASTTIAGKYAKGTLEIAIDASNQGIMMDDANVPFHSRLPRRPRLVHLKDGSGRVLRRSRQPKWKATLVRSNWLVREWVVHHERPIYIRYSARSRFFQCNSIWVDEAIAASRFATPYARQLGFEIVSEDRIPIVSGLLEVQISFFLYPKIRWLRLSVGDEIVYEEGDVTLSEIQLLVSQIAILLRRRQRNQAN